MNLAHVHLILNHVPIVGIPVALAFLAFGLLKGGVSTQRFSLLVLFGIAILAIPIYLTGEPAEHVVELLPGVLESSIEAHEDAALYSLVLALATGAIALLALFWQTNLKRGRTINLCVLFVGVVAFGSLVYTANLGGQIRHTELRPAAIAPIESAEKSE